MRGKKSKQQLAPRLGIYDLIEDTVYAANYTRVHERKIWPCTFLDKALSGDGDEIQFKHCECFNRSETCEF